MIRLQSWSRFGAKCERVVLQMEGKNTFSWWLPYFIEVNFGLYSTFYMSLYNVPASILSRFELV